jgi:hypothetical protein
MKDTFFETRRPEVFLSSVWADTQRAAELAERRALEDARADAAAVWALADMSIPQDIQEFGTRHGIPELAKEVWRSAFIAGWRAYARSSPPLPDDKPEES